MTGQRPEKIRKRDKALEGQRSSTPEVAELIRKLLRDQKSTSSGEARLRAALQLRKFKKEHPEEWEELLKTVRKPG